jgi:hypothetical protein
MAISHLTGSPTRGVIPHVGIKRPSGKYDMGENRSLFKMFYLANKNGERYDGFEKMVGR